MAPFTERCGTCGGETPHEVRIEIREEGQPSEYVMYSREPYRIATCRACGAERVQRMNNA
jgi:hypothetical protein